MILGKYYNNNFLLLGVMLLFASTPLESIAVVENFSIAKLTVLLLFFAWAFKGFPVKVTPILKMYIPYTIYAIVMALVGIDVETSFRSIMYFLLPSLLVSVIITSCLSDHDNLKYMLFAFLVGCLIAAINAIMSRQSTYDSALFDNMERVTALGADQNTISFVWNMGIVILMSFLKVRTSSLQKGIIISAISILAFSVLITGSRTGAMIMLLTFAIFIADSRNLYMYICACILGIITFFVFIPLLPESIIERFLDSKDVASSGDFSGRGEIWYNGWRAFMNENIVTGVGYSNFCELYRKYYGIPLASHNTYLTYIVEFGLLGCWLFFRILLQMFTYILKICKSSRSKFALCYILPFFLVMFTLETEYKRWLFILGPVLYSLYEFEFQRRDWDRLSKR